MIYFNFEKANGHEPIAPYRSQSINISLLIFIIIFENTIIHIFT